MNLLDTLLQRRNLTAEQAEHLLGELTDPQIHDARKGALLTALRCKGMVANELRGMATAMAKAAVQVEVDRMSPLVDTCGTGGDGSNSFNISTSTALLAAACGVRVVKHGNRSVSSKCGSADVLQVLGVPLATSPKDARRHLKKTGFTFLFAPAFHPAMKAVVPVRRAMGVRTAFNLLGPLTNPARPDFQVLGAYSPEGAKLIANALADMDVERAFVVHGAQGWDEATPVGPFVRFTVTAGAVQRETLDPQIAYGIPRCTAADLAGGDADENADIIRSVFAGESGPCRDAVVLNTALVLQVVGRVVDGHEAVKIASHAIDQGRATELLYALSALESHRP